MGKISEKNLNLSSFRQLLLQYFKGGKIQKICQDYDWFFWGFKGSFETLKKKLSE